MMNVVIPSPYFVTFYIYSIYLIMHKTVGGLLSLLYPLVIVVLVCSCFYTYNGPV